VREGIQLVGGSRIARARAGSDSNRRELSMTDAPHPSRPEIYPKPYIVKPMIPVLEDLLKTTDKVFEWGSGSSTFWFAERVLRVVTVEHDDRWAALMYEEGLKRDTQNIRMWHTPSYTPEHYAKTILIPENRILWDLIFIDGPQETRNRCVELAMPYIVYGGSILLDNSNTIEVQEGIKLMEEKGWKGKRIDGPFYLGPHFMGTGQTGLWQKPLR
jgi:hypothetical protein